MKAKILFISTLLTIGILLSFNVYKPKTPVVKKEIKISGFNRIYTYSSIDLYVTQGNEEKIIVETNQEYQKNVKIYLKGTTLNIETKGQIINPEKFNVYITVKNLTDISSAGSGDIKTTNQLNSKKLNFKIKGSGDLEANLNSETVSIEINGSGDVQLEGKIKNLNIHSFGSGDIEINNIDLNSILISSKGSGDIELKGSANYCNIDLNGSGDIEAKYFKVKETNINSEGSGDITIYVENTVNANIQGSGDFKFLGNPENKKIITKNSNIR